MQDTARLCDGARAEIDGLVGEGYSLTPDEIVHINALAWQVETPETRRQLSRGSPVPVGGVTLWPLTLAASCWYDDVGCTLRPKWLRTIALGYAMAHCYDGADLPASGSAAAVAVLRFFHSLRCRTKELTLAMSEILAQDSEGEQPPDPSEPRGMGRGELSMHLATATGVSPDFWERRCSQSYVFETCAVIETQNREAGKPSKGDPRIRAIRALGWYVEKIKRRKNNEANK